jgi:5-formyltetrahydrofolate cyclo-ligase
VSEKGALRQEVLAAREALSAEDRAAFSEAACGRVMELDCWRQADTVLLFASFGSEVQTGGLIEAALEQGRTVVLPRVNRERKELDLFCVTEPGVQLTAGVWGIPEPMPDRCTLAQVSRIGCVVLPGVAFDRQGGRMGYGGGFYDRVLADLAPIQAAATVGICFELQLVPRVPREAHDRRVACVCTERDVYRCSEPDQEACP